MHKQYTWLVHMVIHNNQGYKEGRIMHYNFKINLINPYEDRHYWCKSL